MHAFFSPEAGQTDVFRVGEAQASLEASASSGLSRIFGMELFHGSRSQELTSYGEF